MNKLKLLAVLVNYGDEQHKYLDKVVSNLKKFERYEVTVIVQSNIALNIEGIDKVNILVLENYQFLPLTCRKVIWENKNDYDIFIYGENDHLFLEKHVDKHMEYTKILPKNRIAGLIQYEENQKGKYYPGYHLHFDWAYQSVEIYNNKKFAHFTNTHQASFIITKEQLLNVGKKIDFSNLVENNALSLLSRISNKIRKAFNLPVNTDNNYSVKCKVNTDIYDYGGMRKMICITEFEDNLIHHLPNLYIEGSKGRNKFRSDDDRMNKALKKLLKDNA